MRLECTAHNLLLDCNLQLGTPGGVVDVIGRLVALWTPLYRVLPTIYLKYDLNNNRGSQLLFPSSKLSNIAKCALFTSISLVETVFQSSR